ncbi:hypothetical protein GCM10009642_11700 [Nocardiopsis metallicus]
MFRRRGRIVVKYGAGPVRPGSRFRLNRLRTFAVPSLARHRRGTELVCACEHGVGFDDVAPQA